MARSQPGVVIRSGVVGAEKDRDPGRFAGAQRDRQALCHAERSEASRRGCCPSGRFAALSVTGRRYVTLNAVKRPGEDAAHRDASLRSA